MKTPKSLIKTYSELKRIETFEDRYRYLRLNGVAFETTFGFDRYANQQFYQSTEWRNLRNQIIVRDNGCDLGDPNRPISGTIYIHHMNPIDIDDIEQASDYLLNPEYLICVSKNTHDAIHYGDEGLLKRYDVITRSVNDTCPWKA